MKDKNEAVKECLDDNQDWQAFFDNTLKAMIEQRKGALYDDPRFPKADDEEANFITRLIDNFKLPKVKHSSSDPDEMADFQPKGMYEDDSAQTKQEDMDRLIQPYLSFEDEGEEVHEEFKVNEVERKPEYDIAKYSSNDGRQKPIINFNEDDEEETGTSVMQRMELKEQQRTKNSRYGGFGMVQIPKSKKKSEVLGVTGVDFDSDEEESKDRYGKKRQTNDSDDEDIERDESLTLDQLDGWMTKIN